MDDHAADLLGALDALGLERVALGSHSFGGLLTLYVAVRLVFFVLAGAFIGALSFSLVSRVSRLDRLNSRS